MRKNIGPFRKKNSRESNELKGKNIRLNKYIANNSDLTRREADKLIFEGKISVNGVIIKEPGTLVSQKDQILNNSKTLKKNTYDYVLLNKPKDLEFKKDNTDTKLYVESLIKNSTKSSLTPVAELKKEASGLQLMTNDLDLIKKIETNAQKKPVVYFIKLANEITEDKLEEIRQGIELDGLHFQPSEITFSNPENKSEIGLEINSISQELIFSLFSHFKIKIELLDRVYIAGLSKKGLQRGHWRHLKTTEIASLKMGSYR